MGEPIPKEFGAVAALAGRQPVGELAADCVTIEKTGNGQIRVIAGSAPAAVVASAPGPSGEPVRVAVPADAWADAFKRLKDCDALTLEVVPSGVTLSASCGETVTIAATDTRHPIPAEVVPRDARPPLAVVEAGDLLSALRVLIAVAGKRAPVALLPRQPTRPGGALPVGLLLATTAGGVEVRAGVRPAG
jgi:hypothetical protein